MYCLTCDQEVPTQGPDCPQCQGTLGLVAEGRGYVPQLEKLAESWRAGQLEYSDLESRLERLVLCIEAMLNKLGDETGQGMANLELDDTQQATVADFVRPLREGWEKQLELIRSLDTDNGWEEFLKAFEAAQVETVRASEALHPLTPALAASAAGGPEAV